MGSESGSGAPRLAAILDGAGKGISCLIHRTLVAAFGRLFRNWNRELHMKNKPVLFVAVAALAALGACATGGQDFGGYTRERDFRWELLAGFNSVIITGYRGNDADVRIPSEIRGRTVVGIGAGAFESNGIASVSFPASIRTIGPSAFANNQITEVVIPGRVAIVGSSAFANNRLTSVVIPFNVRHIESSAFANNQLTEVNLPSYLQSIGEAAFANNQLTSVTGARHLESRAPNAFAGNPLLTNIPPTSAERRDLARAEREQAEQAEQLRLAELWRQAGNSLGNLANTSWHVHIQDTLLGTSNTQNRLDFGDGDFILQMTGTSFGFPVNRVNRGTFRVSGSTVIIRNSEGVYQGGILVGNTLTVSDAVFRRVP